MDDGLAGVPRLRLSGWHVAAEKREGAVGERRRTPGSGPAVWHGGLMASESTHRTLTVERIAPGEFAAVNSRGGRIVFGTGADESFTPTELLLVAIGGCTAIDVDIITTRRAEPESFEIVIDA